MDRNRLFFRYDLEKKARDLQIIINNDHFNEGVKNGPVIGEIKIKSFKDDVYRVIKKIRSSYNSPTRVSLD